MNRQVGQDVLNIIIDFIGTNYDCTKGCHAFTKKGKRCKTKPAGDFIFCRKHRNLIQKLSNGDDIKDIAIAYLLMVYKGSNRKKITSNGIISKKVQEVPMWVGRSSCVSDSWFYETRYRRKKKVGYCICPWCIEQYFKSEFFYRYSDRIISIRKIIDNDNYPYNSIIDLFNNNVVRINETIKKKSKKKSIDFWYSTMIPKKRLLNQFKFHYFKFHYFLPLSFNPFKIIMNSYNECANNTKSVFKANGFDDIVKTQYMKTNHSIWSGNAHRLENTCHLVALSSYEMTNIVVFKKIIKNYIIELPDDIINHICSFLYDKKTYKKSFLRKKRTQFWKLVDPKRNFWAKVNENGEYIRYDALAGAGGRL